MKMELQKMVHLFHYILLAHHQIVELNPRAQLPSI